MTAILRIVAVQFGMGLLVALAALALAGRPEAVSALLGGLVCAIPNAMLGLRIALAGATGDARRLLRATYVAVALKWVMTASLFAAVFVLVKPLAAGWLFAGFIVAQVSVVGAAALVGGEGEKLARGAPAPR